MFLSKSITAKNAKKKHYAKFAKNTFYGNLRDLRETVLRCQTFLQYLYEMSDDEMHRQTSLAKRERLTSFAAGERLTSSFTCLPRSLAECLTFRWKRSDKSSIFKIKKSQNRKIIACCEINNSQTRISDLLYSVFCILSSFVFASPCLCGECETPDFRHQTSVFRLQSTVFFSLCVSASLR
jgi:hypothetical protein